MNFITAFCLIVAAITMATVSGQSCKYGKKTYKDGQSMSLFPCSSCKCSGGSIECVDIPCPLYKCTKGAAPVLKKGACCPTCP